jgi:hypothetical protein
MKPMTVGKLAAGIAGTAGAGSMGVLAEALGRFAAARAVPAAMWAVMAALMGATAALGALALLLDFRQKKLEIQSAAELEKGRRAMYRPLPERSAADPAPSSDRVNALCVFRFVERMLLTALSGSARTAVTDDGGGVDEAPKSHRAARTPTSFGLIPCRCRSGS